MLAAVLDLVPPRCGRRQAAFLPAAELDFAPVHLGLSSPGELLVEAMLYVSSSQRSHPDGPSDGCIRNCRNEKCVSKE